MKKTDMAIDVRKIWLGVELSPLLPYGTIVSLSSSSLFCERKVIGQY